MRRAELPRQPRDALDALALRAELGVEGDAEMVEPRHALVERLLQVEAELLGRRLQLVEIGQIALVGLPEIAAHPRAARAPPCRCRRDLLAAVPRLDVGGQDEAVGERVGRRLAARVDEALLVGADGQPDHLGGNVEKVLLERAHQHDRPFDQPRHLLEQALVLDQLEPAGEGEVLGVGQDDLLAPVGIEHDLRRLELRGIIVEAAHA